MDIFKIVGVGILGVITAGFIKSAKSEFSVFVVLATGLVILIMIAKGMSEVLVKFSEIVAKTGIPSALYRAILKIVGVGYLTEFLLISGVSSFIYLIAALVSRFL